MALNTRPLFDPRWAFMGKEHARRAMMATGRVYRRFGDVTWNKEAVWLTDRDPAVGADTLIYQGPMRVQENLLWRGRKQRWGDVTVTEHAVNIQIDMRENAVAGPEPLFVPNDYVKVTEVLELDGVKVSEQILHTLYSVRVVGGGSNQWQMSLLCDQDQTQVGVPR